jgi:hypothetical protein
MNACSSSLLHTLIRKESHSLLQYLSDAYPWTAAQDHARRDRILARSRREREAIGALVRFCIRHGIGYPALGAYPERFMDLNFVSLDSLMPALLAEQKQRIAELEWSLLTVPEPARDVVRDLLDVKRQTLVELEGTPAPTAAA